MSQLTNHWLTEWKQKFDGTPGACETHMALACLLSAHLCRPILHEDVPSWWWEIYILLFTTYYRSLPRSYVVNSSQWHLGSSSLDYKLQTPCLLVHIQGQLTVQYCVWKDSEYVSILYRLKRIVTQLGQWQQNPILIKALLSVWVAALWSSSSFSFVCWHYSHEFPIFCF